MSEITPRLGSLSRRLMDLLGGRFHYLLATAAAAISPLFLGPAQVRLIGLSGYGQIVTVVLLAGMIASIANLGLSNSIVAKSAALDHPAQYVGSLMLKSALPSIAVATLFLGLALIATALFPHVSLGGTQAISEGALAGFALSQSRLWLEGLRAAGKSGAYLCLSSTVVLFCPLVATLAVYFQNGPGTYLATWSFALTLLIGVKMIQLVRKGVSDKNNVAISLPELIRFGAPLTLNLLVGTALAFSDRIAIAANIGISAVGQYQLACLAGLASVLVCNGLNLWWLPRIVSAPEGAGHGALVRMLRETTALVLVYSAFLAVGLSTYASFVIPDKTQRPIVVSVGLLIGVAALSQPLYLAGTNYLYWSGRTGSLAGKSIAANILQGVGTWLVAGHFGLYGAAIVVIAAQWLQALLVGASVFRESNEKADIAISMAFTLIAAILLGSISMSSLSGGGLVPMQISLLVLCFLIVVVIRYIRQGREINEANSYSTV